MRRHAAALTFALAGLISLLAAAGCLSMDRREMLIQDIAAAREFVEATLPPGDLRDRMIRRLTVAQSLEEVLQVRAAVRAARANANSAAAASQPSPNR